MFMGKSNNNGNGIHVNTGLYVSYSEECMLKIGAWNTNLSVKFHPAKGVNAEGIRQYAQDNSEIINTSLTVDNTTALLKGLTDVINPALAEKKEGSVSVAMGSDKNRKVMTVKTDGDKVYVSVTINVSDQGIADENSTITHTFNKKEYMINYDPATGSGETVSTNSDYENFVQKLKDIYKLTAAVAHSINYANAIKSSYSSNRQNANSGYNSGSTNNYSAPVNNYGNADMSDFLPIQ